MTTNQSPAQRTNTLAVVAFVIAFFAAFVGSIIGFVALKEIQRTGEGGKGLAKAAIVVGFILTALNIAIGVLVFVSWTNVSGSPYPG